MTLDHRFRAPPQRESDFNLKRSEDMRKRVGTKVYDTDKARFICSTPDGDLYKKNNGSFFLWRKEMLPHDVSYSEAKEYTDILGIESEKEPETRVTNNSPVVRFSQAEQMLISDIADRNGMSNRAFVMLCVEEYIRNHSQKPDS